MISVRALLPVVVSAILLFGMAVGCGGDALSSGERQAAPPVATAIVSGVAELPGGETAPPGATARVEIRDVSYADGPSILIGATEFDASEASEIPFRVAYVEQRVDVERQDYAVFVEVSHWVPDEDPSRPFSGQTEDLYLNSNMQEVISRGNPSTGIVIPLEAISG